MKKLITLLLTSLLMLSLCTAEEPAATPAPVPRFTAAELSRMTYLSLTDAYQAACGSWWDWPMETWLDYSDNLRQLPYIGSRTGRAIAATHYVLPPQDALPEADAAAIAVTTLDTDDLRYHSSVFFESEGRIIRKAALSVDQTISFTVELDAVTGEVLGVYERTSEGAGQFFVPHDVWIATPMPEPTDG